MNHPKCSDFQIGLFVLLTILCVVFGYAAFDRQEIEMLKVQAKAAERSAIDHNDRIIELEKRMRW